MNMKAILSLFLSIVFVLLIQIKTSAYYDKHIYISVSINDKLVKTDTEPYQKDNRVYVSLRDICDALKLNLTWVKEEDKMVITNGDKKIELFTKPEARRKAIVDGKEYTMDSPLEITNNRTMVPARFLAEQMGFKAEWEGYTFTLKLKKDGVIIDAASEANRSYSDDDLIWLGRIITVEAGECGFENKLAVANVVLNRTKNPEYPSTVYGVIFDRKWCVQFPPAFRSGFKEIIPSDDCRIAAKMALEGVNNVGECLQFNDVLYSSKRAKLFKRIGGQYFYY